MINNINENTDFNPLQLFCKSNSTSLVYVKLREKIQEICQLSYHAYNYNKQLQLTFAKFEQHKKCIKEIVCTLGVDENSYRDFNSMTMILYSLLGRLYDKLRGVISQNPIGFLVSMLSILEYNFHITNGVILWLKGRYFEDSENIEPTDNFAKMLVTIMEHYKESDPEICKAMYTEFSYCLTIEKQSIQRIIKFLGNTISYEESLDKFFSIPISKQDFFEVLDTGLAINEVSNIIEQIDEGVLKPNSIKLCRDGSIEVDDDNNESFYDQNIEVLNKGELSHDSEEIKREINVLCKKHIGITWDDLFYLNNELVNIYNVSDEFLIGTVEEFQQLFMHILGCESEVAENLINHLKPCYEKDDFSWIKNRPIKRCLIPIKGGIVTCPVGVLNYALLSFFNDIRGVDRLEEGEFKNELKKVQRKINKAFEYKVCTLLSKSLKNSIVFELN